MESEVEEDTMRVLALTALEELAALKKKVALFYAEEIIVRGDKNLIRTHNHIFGNTL